MPKPIIKVDCLSKSYRLGSADAGTFFDSLTFWNRKRHPLIQGPASLADVPDIRARGSQRDGQREASRWRTSRGPAGGRVSPPPYDPERGTFWALHEVSFEVSRGEIIGVIGRNGAGKSTLLKILAKITAPTSGTAKLAGRVSSLLEVGTGFHQELTGRENIYLNGALLGMRTREIDRKFDAIVAFAEMDRFIDTPVKFYSSGMYLRLAFAVAAHLEPEILLVDEVLAVGDYAFQQKCLDKTREFAGGGRTVIFVSHNLGAVSRLCERAIFLEHGRLFQLGPVNEVIQTYVSRGIAHRSKYTQPSDPTKAMSLRRAEIVAPDGHIRSEIGYHEKFKIAIEYEVHSPISGASVAVGIGTAEQIPVFVSSDYDAAPERLETRQPGFYRTEVEIPERWLNTGRFLVMVYLANTANNLVYDKVEALSFDIVETGTPGAKRGITSRKGVLQPVLPWTVIRLKKAA